MVVGFAITDITPHSALLRLLCSMLGLTSMEELCVVCFLFFCVAGVFRYSKLHLIPSSVPG